MFSLDSVLNALGVVGSIGGTGWIIARIAPGISKGLVRALPAIKAWITTLDDKAVAALPEKVKSIIPPEMIMWACETWDAGGTAGVQAVEDFARDPKLVVEFLRILKGNPDLIFPRMAELFGKWAAGGFKKDETPEEIKPIANEARTNVAAKLMMAHTAALPSELQPTEEEARAVVAAKAPAIGRTIPVPLVDSKNPPILMRPDEIQAEIERLRAGLQK